MPDGKEKYTMTIEQCYSAIESNYEEVLGRFAGNKMLVEKFARKFLEFARHGRALTGVSPEHAQIVGSV